MNTSGRITLGKYSPCENDLALLENTQLQIVQT